MKKMDLENIHTLMDQYMKDIGLMIVGKGRVRLFIRMEIISKVYLRRTIKRVTLNGGNGVLKAH